MVARVPTPASSAARALPPAASIRRPNADPRTAAAVTINMPTRMTTGAGRPSTLPLPSPTRSSDVKVTIRPSVMSWAMPRPATMRISVAMIGWMPNTATRRPFHNPQARPGAERHRKHKRQCVAVGEARRDGAGDRHHGSDGQIDAAGGYDQHHAERQERHRRAAIEDVDETAEQLGRPESEHRRIAARLSGRPKE